MYVYVYIYIYLTPLGIARKDRRPPKIKTEFVVHVLPTFTLEHIGNAIPEMAKMLLLGPRMLLSVEVLHPLSLSSKEKPYGVFPVMS